MNVLSKNLILGVLFVSSAAFSSSDARVNVTFEKPERFTDFKTQANLRFKDREKLMKQLTELMDKSADKRIDKDQKLNINISNIDMAGTFLYGTSDLYRVILEFDRIRLDFSYELLDSDNKIIKQGDVNLTSRSRQPVTRLRNEYKNTQFSHEMPLFDDWLKTL